MGVNPHRNCILFSVFPSLLVLWFWFAGYQRAGRPDRPRGANSRKVRDGGRHLIETTLPLASPRLNHDDERPQPSSSVIMLDIGPPQQPKTWLGGVRRLEAKLQDRNHDLVLLSPSTACVSVNNIH